MDVVKSNFREAYEQLKEELPKVNFIIDLIVNALLFT